jgi:hypothetical protein
MRTAAVLLAATLSLAACSGPLEPTPVPAPPPGYSGSVPSPDAQRRIDDLAGREVPVGTAGVAEAGWTVVGFAVVPSEAAPGGKGPVVRLRSGDRFRDHFLPDDAAVDEFARAVEGRRR